MIQVWKSKIICDSLSEQEASIDAAIPMEYIKSEDNSAWFNVSPYWMAFSHFPDNHIWSKIDIEITEEQFKELPIVEMTNEAEIKDLLFECISKRPIWY